MKRLLVTTILLLTLVGQLGFGVRPVAAKQPLQPPEVAARLDEPFTLSLGQWAALDHAAGLAVQFTAVEEDSRCPAQVSCAWSGEALIRLNLRSDSGAVPPPITLSTLPVDERNQLHFQGYTVELLDVQPYPQQEAASAEFAESDYTITLVVRRRTAAAPLPTPTPAPTPISSDEAELLAALGQPFALRVGQVAYLEDADFNLTFRSISDDSGCLTADDCSIMTADGSLALRRGDETQLFSFITSFDPETPFSTDFAGLTVQLTSIKQLTDGGHVAVFVVTEPTPTLVDGPAPDVIERCPYFSRFDATAILQEDLQPSAVANLRFYPQPDLVTDLAGLCGYVAAENIPYPASEAPVIQLLTPVEAARAVVAARLNGATISELLPFVQHVLNENPQSRADDMIKLYTHLTAGLYDEVIPLLAENAAQSATIDSEPISGIGDDGLWLWQKIPGGYFALLLVRTGDELGVVAALLGEQVEALTVLDYAVIIARRLVEQTGVTAPPPMSPTPTPTAEPGDEPGVGCDLLAADATAILGEPIHEQVVIDPEMGCGYVPRSEASPTDEGFLLAEASQGVLLQYLTGDLLIDTLTDMADTVSRGNTRPNQKATQTLFQAALAAGDTAHAIQLLVTLANGSKEWQVEKLPQAGKAAVFVWGRVNERPVAALLQLRETGDVLLVVASLGDQQPKAAVRAALAVVAERFQ